MRHAISAGRQLSVARFYLFLLACVILVSAGRAAAPADATESISLVSTEGTDAAAALLDSALRLQIRDAEDYDAVLAKTKAALKLAEMGRNDDAERIISEVREAREVLLSAVNASRTWVPDVAFVYANMGLYEEALSLVENRHPAMRVEARCWIARALFRAGKTDRALRMMKVARQEEQRAEFEVSHPFASTIAHVYARAGYYRHAREIVMETEEDEPKATALMAITAEWLRPGTEKPPEDVTSSLVKAAMDIEFSELRNRVLRDIAIAFAKTGEVEKSLWLCDRISDTEYRVKVKMCAAEALIEEGDIDRALNLLDEPYEMARELHGALPPSKITGLYARAGRYERALELVRTASEHSGWLSEALAWVARVRAEKGDIEAGMETLSEALEMAVEGPNKPVHPDFSPPEPPDAWQRDGNLKAVATTWGGAVLKNSDSRILNEALKTIARIERPWDRITALKKLAHICGQTELALDQESCELLDDICRAKSGGEKNEETGSRQK